MKNSVILITGGTGTFGQAFAKRCLDNGAAEIRIFSRDEKKQYEMKQCYPNFKFYIGDIRDKNAIETAMEGVDYVFHAAAMKQIPSCEQYPLEAIKTNVLGGNNVIDAAIKYKVKKVVCLSTDKAVNPISTMGLTKALMEKLALTKAKESKNTTICITRFCNLIASNGSVVPLFLNQIQQNLPLTLTNPDMTRFMMTLSEAMDLVEQAMLNGKNGDIYIHYTKPCKIKDLALALCDFANVPASYPINVTGTRPGEKQHEALLTHEEAQHAFIQGKYIIISNTNQSIDIPYESNNIPVLDKNEILTLLQTM